MKTENKLTDVRGRWEGGDAVLFSRKGKVNGLLGEVLVTLTMSERVAGFEVSAPSYRVMRYFVLLRKWEASCDYEGVDIGAAIGKVVDSFEG